MEIYKKKCKCKGKVLSLSRLCFQIYICVGLFCSISNGDNHVTSNKEELLATPSGSSKRDDPGGGNNISSPFSIVSSESPAITSSASNTIRTTKKEPSMTFSYPMKNHIRFEGETLRLTCEAKGYPPPLRIQWSKDHLPLEKQNRRIKIRRKDMGDESSLRSVVRIRNLEIMDKGIYRCDVSNNINTISSESLVQVHPKKLKNWQRQHNNKHQTVCLIHKSIEFYSN